MDPLSDVLQLISARSYITTGQSAGSRWCMRYPGFEGMKFIAIQKGCLWFRLESEQDWRPLSPGDGLIITRSAPFLLSTDPALLPKTSTAVPYVMRNGLADYGGTDTLLLAGKMEIDQAGAEPLLSVLPDVIPMTTGSDSSSVLNWLMGRLHDENQSLKPGASLACNHLMQLVMIEGIRSWILSDTSELISWMGALKEPRILRVLAAIHEFPEKSWQLIELAKIAGMSRAGFARRFSESTGTSPMSYLTQWRMHIASKALRLSKEPIKGLAYRLGYASESTFSSVFRRVYGVSPTQHRTQFADGPAYRLAPFNKAKE